LSCKPPFYGDDDREILNSVKEGKYSMTGPEWKNITSEAKDFIKNMLEYDPVKRITAEKAINHAWIKKKVHETIDLKSTVSALNNLRTFRVNLDV
jgi:calcium-dependent protein kinase